MFNTAFRVNWNLTTATLLTLHTHVCTHIRTLLDFMKEGVFHVNNVNNPNPCKCCESEEVLLLLQRKCKRIHRVKKQKVKVKIST